MKQKPGVDGGETAHFQAMVMERYDQGASPSLVVSDMLDVCVPPSSAFVETFDELLARGDMKSVRAMFLGLVVQVRALRAFSNWADRVRCNGCTKKNNEVPRRDH
jgi:hypothetical protein